MAQIWPKKSLKFETSFFNVRHFENFQYCYLNTYDSHKHKF